jgi:hypothetical protein
VGIKKGAARRPPGLAQSALDGDIPPLKSGNVSEE